MASGWEGSALRPEGRFRRRALPQRTVADAVIVARPNDGAPVALPATAAALWHCLAGWVSLDEAVSALAIVFPEVDRQEVLSTVVEVLDRLMAEGLLERG